MANLLDLAQKMGISTTPADVEKKNTITVKRRPWLEEEIETPVTSKELPRAVPRERISIQRGELTKPEAKLKQTDNALKKIEEKTDGLLKKAKERDDRHAPPTSNQPQSIIKHTSTLHQKEPRASHFAFISLPPRKIPRQILNHIKSNAFISNEQWFSKIDTYELMSSTGKTAHYLSVAIGRLVLEKWFEIIESSSGGYRILKIDPELYGIS